MNHTLNVDPPSALRDTPITIQAAGFEPRRPVTLRARTSDESGQVWEASATFAADASGKVSPSQGTPICGTYARADAMGPFWSMLPVGVKDARAKAFTWRTLRPMVATLTAESQGRTRASIEVERLAVLDEARVVREPIREEGLVGALFRPVSSGRLPAVMVLGGSEGGVRESWAALLASRGYAALALAYFGVDPLPPELVEVPMEYFAHALGWLKGRSVVDPERIAVVGASKGGELALLLGAIYPHDLKAVVAYAPSAVAWQGIPSYRRPRRFGRREVPGSSWTLGGEPLPHVKVRTPSLPVSLRLAWSFVRNRSVAFRALYERSLEDETAVERASIAVEKIAGPVLLVSGTDDQLWPSTRLCEMVIDRLKAHGHPFSYQHLRYKNAGHLIGVPYSPSITTKVGGLVTGGDPEANAFASADSWPKVLGFLEDHLKKGATHLSRPPG